MTRSVDTADRRRGGDDGFALLTVLGSMVVVTMFLLSSLAYALNNAAPSRADQDAKAALAAAQAGIEEFASRLSLDDTYYANNGGAHSANPAFTREVAVQGTNGAAATYRYKLLTDSNTTGLQGLVRLAVTGCSIPVPVASTDTDPTPCKDGGGVERELVAEYRPDGFLKYIYFTDLEDADPAIVTGNEKVGVGDPPVYEKIDTGTNTKDNKDTLITYRATKGLLLDICSTHYYAGRHQRRFTVGKYIEIRQPRINGKNDGPPTETIKDASASEPITFFPYPAGDSPCYEIRFGGQDVVAGAAHSNDSLGLSGPVDFTKKVTSSWGTIPTLKPGMTYLPPPSDGKLWWGDKTLTLPGFSPVHGGPIPMPASNSSLKAKADPSVAGAPGCLYTGHTRIQFDGDDMYVLSPGTTSTTGTPLRCYNTATPNVEQRIDEIPPVIYVRDSPDGTCGTLSDIGYPKTAEGELHGPGWRTTEYSCRFGNAFVSGKAGGVSGKLSGRVTIATERDVIVTGDTMYQSGMKGADALGLIPQGSAWVYHPVRYNSAACTPEPWCHYENLPTVPVVRRIDAAVLSVGHSFVAQHWNLGQALSSETAETACEPQNIDPATTCTKLTVRGSIIQKHRGAVAEPYRPATSTTTEKPRSGYVKNYIYDERLRNAPPPFFLQPKDAWRLRNVTD